MNFCRLRHHRQPWAWALLLALVTLAGWGQAHRVLHPGVHTQACVDPADQLAAPTLAHEDGGSLCHLLDHLSQGAGPAPALDRVAATEPPSVPPAVRVLGDHAVSGLNLQARGPPART